MGFHFKNINLYAQMICWYILSLRGSKNALFLDELETINYILKNECSFIRFGDGEFDIMEGRDIHYQKYSDDLANDLKRILEECSGDIYLVGMPGKYLKSSGIPLAKSVLLLKSWAHVRYHFMKKYDVRKIYGDSFLFGKNKEKDYKKIWLNSNISKVFFVHNNPDFAKRFETHYGIPTVFIKVPSHNAYESIADIYNQFKKYEFNSRTQILVSAGPAGKVLAWKLVKDGAWVIDTGHCWDEPLNE